MAFNPKTILVTQKGELSAELTERYAPDLLLNGLTVAGSPMAALECFMDLPIDLCLISDTFKPDDYKALINDVKRLDQHRSCVFVVVSHQKKPPTDRKALKGYGIETIITPLGTPEDREAISSVLREKIHAWELGRRIEDCLVAVGLLSKDVERIARERKRGRDLVYNTSVSDFMRSNVTFSPEVEQKYFEFLMEKMEGAQPFVASAVDVPKEVLERNLPKLSREKYHGASARVWEKLLNRYGDPTAGKKDPPPEEPAVESSELPTDAESDKG